MTCIRKLTITLLLCFSASTGFAAMVPTPGFIDEAQPAELAQNLEQRENIRRQLIELGVDPAEASERVDNLTDRQIASLQQQISELPAGGMSTTNLLLLIIVIILLI